MTLLRFQMLFMHQKSQKGSAKGSVSMTRWEKMRRREHALIALAMPHLSKKYLSLQRRLVHQVGTEELEPTLFGSRLKTSHSKQSSSPDMRMNKSLQSSSDKYPVPRDRTIKASMNESQGLRTSKSHPELCRSLFERRAREGDDR